MLPGSINHRSTPTTFIPINPAYPTKPSPPIKIPISPSWNYNVDQLLIEIISRRNTISIDSIQKIMRIINNTPEPVRDPTIPKQVFFKRPVDDDGYSDYIPRD